MRFSRGRYLLVVAALLSVSSCSRAAADEPALLNDLANRLDKAGDLTFTAEYRLDGGAEALIAQAQDPRRAVYEYPGGKAVFTETEVANCVGLRCTLSTPPSPGTEPALELLATQPTPTASPNAKTTAAGLVAPSSAVR